MSDKRMTCKDLLRVSNHDLSQINMANKFKMPSVLADLFGSLWSAPFLRSNVRGDWALLKQPILSATEAHHEVGWLYKNTTPEQRQLLASTNIQAIQHPYDSPAHRQHVMETRRSQGKERVSRMRADIQPTSETSRL